MASNIGRKTHLKKYLPYGEKWQFFPVAKINCKPKPELIMIEGKPRRPALRTSVSDADSNC